VNPLPIFLGSLMRSILASILALFFALFLLLLGNGLLSTLLVLRGVAEGFSDKFLGILTSVYFLGAFVATLVASTMIKRMGHIRCFTFCTALLGCSTLAYVLVVSPSAWLIIRFMTGFGMFVIYTVVESWLNGQTQDTYRSRVFSVYTLINLLAIAASQQLLLFDSATSYLLFILASFLVTAAVMPISWTRLEQPHVPVDMPSMSILKVFDAAPVAVTGCLISGLIMGPFWGLSPLFISSLGFSNNELAAFISLSILGGAFIQYPVGRWSDKMDRRQALLFTFILATLTVISMALVANYYPKELAVITTLSAIFCGLVLAVYPISVVHLVDRIDKDHLVAGSSCLLMIYGIGSFIGPTAAGFTMEYMGAHALPTYYLIVLVIFTLIISVQLIRSRIIEKPEERESHYVAMVRTSPNILPMHPESEDILDASEEHCEVQRP
jgi:MFS family permease